MTDPQRHKPYDDAAYRASHDPAGAPAPEHTVRWDAASGQSVARRTPSTRAIVAGAWVAAGAVAAGSVLLGYGALGSGGLPFAVGGFGTTERITDVAEPFTNVAIWGEAASVDVRYDDVPTARIIARGPGEEAMAYRVVDGQLMVDHSGRSAGWGWWVTRDGVTIVLPRSMEPSAPGVQVQVTTGSIDVEGRFGEVRLQAQTGSIDAAGEMASLTATTTTGSVDISLEGSQPALVEARTQTGSVDLSLPEGSYHVDARARTGSTEIDVQQDAGSPHRVVVETGTGSIDIND